MRLVQIDALCGGEVLAGPVTMKSGTVLMQPGTVIKREYVSQLKDLGIESVNIEDEEGTSDKSPLINRETMTGYRREVMELIDMHIYKQSRELMELSDLAKKIMKDVLSRKDELKYGFAYVNIGDDMYAHSVNVCAMSVLVADLMEMSSEQIEDIAVGAILHDIGLRYVTIPYENVEISTLNNREQFDYKKHVIHGYSTVQEENWLSDISKTIILSHHELLDGNGYPFRSKGSRIKPEVRIVAVCDIFDSMLHGIGHEKKDINYTISYLEENCGTLYDEKVTNILLGLIK